MAAAGTFSCSAAPEFILITSCLGHQCHSKQGSVQQGSGGVVAKTEVSLPGFESQLLGLEFE